MYLGLGLRLGSGTFAGFDADAVAYFVRAGVTDATAKGQINAFVKGVKALGLWSSIISWPLRSSQNAGTGTTAYSLGGAGTFNGTLTNGPTWSANGVVFDGVNDFIMTSFTAANGPASFGFASKVSALTGNQAILSLDDLTSRKMNLFHTTDAASRVRFEANLNGSMGNRLDINGTNSLNFIFGQASHDGTNFYGQGNNETIQSVAASGTMQGTGANLVFGTRSATFSPILFAGTIAFGYSISSSVNANFTSIYNLYKTTLGTGLGLP
jgi:hypothetical protein